MPRNACSLHFGILLVKNQMLQKSLSLSKFTCIYFDSLILGDKSDMNVFQDIQVWLMKQISSECGK